MGSELDQIAVQKPANHPNARINAFKDLLSRDVVDLDALRTLTFAGVPEDEKSLRAVVWKASGRFSAQRRHCTVVCGVYPCSEKRSGR
jgi:hypothetical protein